MQSTKKYAAKNERSTQEINFHWCEHQAVVDFSMQCSVTKILWVVFRQRKPSCSEFLLELLKREKTKPTKKQEMCQTGDNLHTEVREGTRKTTKEKTYLGHLNKSQKDDSKEAKKVTGNKLLISLASASTERWEQNKHNLHDCST